MILPCTHRPRYGDAGLIPSEFSRGLIAAYLFNEAGGCYAFDAKRRCGNPLISNATLPRWIEDGLYFDGSYQRLYTELPVYDNGTIHLRYRRIAAGSDMRFYISSQDTANFRLYEWDGSSIWVRIGNDNSYTGATNVADYQYHDITLTWGSGVVAVYLDGRKQSWASGGTYTSVPSDTFDIGGRAYGNNYYCAGVIPHCYFFNRVLSDGEIRKLAAHPYSLFYSRAENQVHTIWAVSSGTTEYVSLTIASESYISVAAFRRRFLSLLVESESDAEITASRKRFSSASIESVSDVSIDVLRRRYLSLAIEAESDVLAAVYRKRYADCLIESVSDVSVYIPSETVQVLIESISDIVITAMRKRSVSVNVASVSDVDVLAHRIVYAALTIASESDIDITIAGIDLTNAVIIEVEAKGDIKINAIPRDVNVEIER